MIVESVAIFGITLCILAVFVRSDNADYAMATTPLLIVPAANLLGLPIAKLVNGLLPGNQLYLVRCFADVLGVAAACGLIVLFSGKIKNRKKKQGSRMPSRKNRPVKRQRKQLISKLRMKKMILPNNRLRKNQLNRKPKN